MTRSGRGKNVQPETQSREVWQGWVNLTAGEKWLRADRGCKGRKGITEKARVIENL